MFSNEIRLYFQQINGNLFEEWRFPLITAKLLYVYSQMTDVEAGGSTVFLDAETIIKPQKVLLLKLVFAIIY